LRESSSANVVGGGSSVFFGSINGGGDVSQSHG
jgi:hypothetical protein